MFPLGYRSGLPIYRRPNKSISRMAVLGALEPNEQLPPVRTLAQDLGISLNTVQKAHQLSEQNGTVYSVPGKGSYVSPDFLVLSQQKPRALEKLSEAIANATECGVTQSEVIQRVENHFSGRGSEQ